ncbi:MAG: T9SS type A sorting domain-containing protein [Bacteroidales bacterium]|jgi:hypothetical protein
MKKSTLTKNALTFCLMLLMSSGKKILISTIFIISLFTPSFVIAQVPAFPCAEGFGAVSVGGRGGRVIEVTNLNDAGAGSFRDAVLQTGPRTVVFKVAGTIDMQSDIMISGVAQSYLTIAGQTAPGGGIQLRYYGLSIRNDAHDIIVRYIRHRRGWIDAINSWYYTGFVIANDDGTAPVYNVIVDHCSLGWQQDDNGSWAKVHDVTFQWNIFGEANAYTTMDGASGKGLLVGAEPGYGAWMHNISIHHNYITSNAERNPLISGNGPTEVVNNVIYNWQSFGTGVQTRDAAGSVVNFIGNYYKVGPSTLLNRYEMALSEAGTYTLVQPPQTIYVQDNIGPHRTNSSLPEWNIMGFCGGATPNGEDNNGPASTSFQRNTPWITSSYPITISSATANVTNVLNGAGATLPMRDDIDTRLVNEYNTSTGSVGGDNNWPVLAGGTPYTDTDHDGMPDTWETSNALNPNNSADGAQISVNGYTNLENYLNSLTSCSSLPISLPDAIIVPGSFSYTNGVFTATIKNQGGSPTSGSSIDIGFQVDGVQQTYGSFTVPLAAGASVTINNTTLCSSGGYCGGAYTIPIGTHTITAYADPVNRFAESDETNNTLSQTITVGTTGIVNVTQDGGIKVYPNPFNTSFTLKISSAIILKNTMMKIFDVCGREVKIISINNHETTIEKDELQSGIYFYSIINNNEKITNGKLVVQ